MATFSHLTAAGRRRAGSRVRWGRFQISPALSQLLAIITLLDCISQNSRNPALACHLQIITIGWLYYPNSRAIKCFLVIFKSCCHFCQASSS